MQHLTFREMYEFYQEQTRKHLPLLEYDKMVSVKEQENEVRLLKETLHFERFFFVLNLHTLQLNSVNGVEKWLGYPDHDFTVLKFLQIIHPSQLEAHHITATELISGLMQGNWKVEFMKHRYITNIALKHIKGHYLLFKRLASVFQFNEEHKLLEYVNEFTYVGEFKEDPYAIRASNEDGTKLVWLEEVIKRFRLAFENKNFFTFQELRILRKFAYQDKISAAEIANAFKVKESTIITHKKRILEKAERLFHQKFSTAKDLADYLKEQGLI